MTSTEFLSVWPTNIMVTQLDELLEENDELYKIGKDFFERSFTFSKAFAHRRDTKSLLASTQSPALLKLFQLIQTHLRIYLERFYPEVLFDELGFQFNTFVNFQNVETNWSLPHAHLGHQLVATYYPKVEKGLEEKTDFPGAVCFHDARPLHANWMVRKEKKIVMINPNPGTLVIFPGYLSHSTAPFFDSSSKKLAIVTNVKFFPKADTNEEKMFRPEEIVEFQTRTLK